MNKKGIKKINEVNPERDLPGFMTTFCWLSSYHNHLQEEKTQRKQTRAPK